MPHSPPLPPPWSRRQLLKLGAVSATVAGVAAVGHHLSRQLRAEAQVQIPPVPTVTPSGGNGISPMAFLREFDAGTLKQEKGRQVREFQITAETGTLQLNSAVAFNTWNLNGRVPGPTLRVAQGDRVRVIFHNQGGHSHSLHFHGVHPAAMDGVEPILNGKTTVYEFDAEPYGLHLYHCHIAPVTRHIGKGMYGMLIVDPPGGRPPADEMVLIMAGYDINDDQRNEFYAFNGLPDYYREHPIPIQQNQLVRLYVLNLIELDPVASFHLHANFFKVYPTGMTLTPSQETDVITMGTAERHILEFSFKFPGQYMFHPHQDDIAERGCMGQFEVVASRQLQGLY